MPAGLQALLKERLSTALTCGQPGTWKVLVVDEHSKALLESVYQLFDILHMNITGMEMLMSPRPAQQSLDVVYLLTPTTQNVNRILADFADGRRSYKQVHLYFIDGIHDKLAERLTNGLPDNILQSFVELYCNFRALESQVFSVDSPSTFYTLYGNPGGVVAAEAAQDRFEEDMILHSRSILNLCATLGENPYIRYYQPQHHPPLGPLSVSKTPGSLYGGPSAPKIHPDELAAQQQTPRWKQALSGGSSGPSFSGDQIPKRLAMQIQKDLDEYKALNPDFPPTMNYRPRSVLFVVDRSMDPVAPFLHEFTYQAMVNDLLPVEDGTIYKHKVKTGMGTVEEKVDILSEDDKIWTSIRHMHMKEAIDKLMADFNKFQQEHAGFKSSGEAGGSINDMKDMLASLPQFQETRDKFSLHLDMAQECMGLFEKRKLPQTADIEQCCATGVTAEGKTPKTLVEEMVPLLADNAVSNKDKVRIIALYILFRDGVPDEDRKRLFQHARLSISEQDTINNLVYLGCKIVRTPNDRDKRSRLKQKYSRTEDDYELSRFKPMVKQLIEEQSSNRLDQSSFPYLGEAPADSGPPPASLRQGRPAVQSMQSQTGSLRSARPTWHKAPEARQKATTESRQRFIIFVAGGLTYSERRMAYLIGDALNKEVIIGSTHNVTPESFVAELRSLGRSGIGGNPPNAKALSPYVKIQKSLSGAPPSFQQILDSRIWTEPVGPPALAPPPPMAAPTASAPTRPGSNLLPGGARTSSPAPSFNSRLSFRRDKKKEAGDDQSVVGAPGGEEKKKKGLFKMRWD